MKPTHPKKSEKRDNKREQKIKIRIKGYPAEFIAGRYFFKFSIILKKSFIINFEFLVS